MPSRRRTIIDPPAKAFALRAQCEVRPHSQFKWTCFPGPEDLRLNPICSALSAGLAVILVSKNCVLAERWQHAARKTIEESL